MDICEFPIRISLARPRVSNPASAASEATHDPKEAFYDCSDGQAGDNITRPVGKKDSPRDHQTASDGPDGVPLGRRQHGRRRCQGTDMNGVSGGKGIEPLSGAGLRIRKSIWCD